MCELEDQCQQERREAGLPYPARTPENDGRQERPAPGAPDRDGPVEATLCDAKDWDAGERGEETIDGEQRKCRRRGVDSENSEHGCDQERIKRGFPCGRAGVAGEWAAKAMS